MAYPNMGNVVLAAAGKVSAATPPVVTSPVNIAAASVTRTAIGIWVINVEEAIDFTQRWVHLVINLAGLTGRVQLDPAVKTDNTIGVLGALDGAGDGVPVAGDVAFEFTVWRAIIL